MKLYIRTDTGDIAAVDLTEDQAVDLAACLIFCATGRDTWQGAEDGKYAISDGDRTSNDDAWASVQPEVAS